MGSVKSSGEFSTITGQANMFQLAMKLVMVIEATTGPASGTIMTQNML